MVEITYGISNGTYLEVLSGLKAGDTVYYHKDESFFDMFMMGGNYSGMGGSPDMNNVRPDKPDNGGGRPENMGGGR